jgi:hypothetical protein
VCWLAGSDVLEVTELINLDGKRFTLVSNSAGNAVPGETIFTFEHAELAVRAVYSGGGVKLGAIIGQFDEHDSLVVLFQQVTSTGKLCGGEGSIKIETRPDGKLRFIDDWRFTTNGEGGGQAVWEEL